jgi:hypothetical protein
VSSQQYSNHKNALYCPVVYYMYPGPTATDQQIGNTKQILYKPEDALCGDYPDGVYSSPDPRDLLHEIAPNVGKRWFELGIQLGLKHQQMQEIEQDHKENRRQIAEVFNCWEQQGGTDRVSPYKWKCILDILELRLDLRNLAKNIRGKLNPPSSELCALSQQTLP